MVILDNATGPATELEIAVGHWPFSNNLAEQIWFARPNLLYISNGEAIDSL